MEKPARMRPGDDVAQGVERCGNRVLDINCD
jgi:hypothetical protein